MESSRSEGTRRTYAAGWRRFVGWSEREGHVALPAHPVTVAAYLVDAADTRTETGERAYAVATFGTWIAAINHQHRPTGHLSPSAHELVTATLSGTRREYAAVGDRLAGADIGEIDDLRDSLTALSQLAMNTLTLPQMLTHIAEFAVNAIPGADGAGFDPRPRPRETSG